MQASIPPHPRARVLIVEDSEDWQDLLATLVGRSPHLNLVALVDTAGEAIASLKETQADLLILDWHLRKGSGLEVLAAAKIRQARCKVVVFTISDSPRDRAAAIAGGADHFLSKKDEPLGLIRLLEQLAQARELPAASVASQSPFTD